MTVNETFEQLVLEADLNSPAPEVEPARQAWFLARAREIVQRRSQAAGRKPIRRRSLEFSGVPVLKRQRRKTLIFLFITPVQSETTPTSVSSAGSEGPGISKRTARE